MPDVPHADRNATPEKLSLNPFSGSDQRSPVVLAVDDHRDTLEVLQRILERGGRTVFTAASVAESLAIAARQRIDLIITDLGLPDGDGAEVLAQLRAIQPAVKAIALSGADAGHPEVQPRLARFDRHLMKPVDFDALDSALRELLAD